ncbi:hypothetical protein [Azoarcus sp. KH32C]|uniref:type IV pilus modification PilV family protein n=1 Tax=Azoarcus sp. KH32C TaxID=748247 RepID=UPI0002386EFF|nr:hypothetical protein [Azoarcus sp. KH32C]BAL25519.1 hypothetical protein AZKH_3230 [Azoarcus sp. KH32C]
MKFRSPTKSRGLVADARGSSLLEALLAVVILGFGLLAVAKLQVTIGDALSTGRDRVQALLLAEEEMDRLRSFDLIDNAAGSPDYALHLGYNQVAAQSVSALSSTDYPNYVTSFSRAVSVSTNPVTFNSQVPDFKLTTVDLSWSDKKGTAQTFSLPSVIAKHDPSDAAWLIACQTDEDIRCGTKDKIKTPYNRNLRIPYPAKDLGGGKSAFAPPGFGSKRIVFDNDTGTIQYLCNDADGVISNDVVANLTNGAYTDCQSLNGYLISGFITAGVSPRTPPDFLNIGTTADLTDTTTINGQTSISMLPSITAPASLVQCFDDSETATKQYASTISYVCIVTPNDSDGNPDTPSVWSGTLGIDLTGTGVAIGTGSSDVKVCRFGASGTSDGTTTSNRAHHSNYVDVTETLENQNFILIQGNRNCDSSLSEVQHQP